VEIVAEPARALASQLMAFAEVAVGRDPRRPPHGPDHQPARVLRADRQLGAEGRIDIRKLEVLDAGAEAVFGYLAGGRT